MSVFARGKGSLIAQASANLVYIVLLVKTYNIGQMEIIMGVTMVTDCARDMKEKDGKNSLY